MSSQPHRNSFGAELSRRKPGGALRVAGAGDGVAEVTDVLYPVGARSVCQRDTHRMAAAEHVDRRAVFAGRWFQAGQRRRTGGAP